MKTKWIGMFAVLVFGCSNARSFTASAPLADGADGADGDAMNGPASPDQSSTNPNDGGPTGGTFTCSPRQPGELIDYPDPTTALLLGPAVAFDPQNKIDQALTNPDQLGRMLFENHSVASYADNFYDYTMVMYSLYYRSCDTRYLDEARRSAIAYIDAPETNPDNMFKQVANQPGGLGPNTIFVAPIGAALYYLDTGDVRGRDQVAAFVGIHYAYYLTETWWDCRGAAIPLLSMATAMALGDGDRIIDSATYGPTSIRVISQKMLDFALSRQEPVWYPDHPELIGSWISSYDDVKPYTGTVFQCAYLLQGLALYDAAVGDPRIIPAMQKAEEYYYRETWGPNTGYARDPEHWGFWYEKYADGEFLNWGIFSSLNPFWVWPYGYLYDKTKDPTILAHGQDVFDGFAAYVDWDPAFSGFPAKVIGETGRSIFRWDGYLVKNGMPYQRP